jgi:hypothetical protein
MPSLFLTLNGDACMKLRQNGTVFLMIKLSASMVGPGLNSKQIERRTSNVQHRTSNIDDATLYLILKQANHAEDVI